MTTAPLLSIGIIFKNEERCIERCLKSLQPLRDTIPCEVIMADTGAEDKSREIAEQYADKVFDFLWVDDFAAARNAVMDRCTGKWYLSIDCDEWLGENISELVAFLQSTHKINYANVTLRNYFSEELEKSESFSEFHPLRLVRMSTGIRYEGTIHETWHYHGECKTLPNTILHHDGYFFPDPKLAKKKMQRNMELLVRELEKDPSDLRTLSQCMESSKAFPEHVSYVRRTVQQVQEHCRYWKYYGPSVLRDAVAAAYQYDLPELEEWIELAENMFPDSIFIQVDMNHFVFIAAHSAENWEKAIQYGERYRKGLLLVRADSLSPAVEEELGITGLRMADADTERSALTALADAYLQVGNGTQALKLVQQLVNQKLSFGQLRNTIITLCHLHAQTLLDIEPSLSALYEQITWKEEDKKRQTACLAIFNHLASLTFTKAYQKEEKNNSYFYRSTYTLFCALSDQCEVGRAASLMLESDPEQMRAILTKVEDWAGLPIEALSLALHAGIEFPLEENPVNIEVLDGLASKLTKGDNYARQMALAIPEEQQYPNWQHLYWAQSLTLASLRTYNWKAVQNQQQDEKSGIHSDVDGGTSEEGLALIRRFAQIESKLLPLLYAPQALTEENAALLPSMHRWGYYCTQALDALDSGKPQEYLTILRKGLKACPSEKDMVQFLLNRFMEDAQPKASQELMALAEKVRMILSAYDPNDPAVAAIRESPAYQQVAWIIEPLSANMVQ